MIAIHIVIHGYIHIACRIAVLVNGTTRIFASKTTG